jgi:hypothetical protein
MSRILFSFAFSLALLGFANAQEQIDVKSIQMYLTTDTSGIIIKANNAAGNEVIYNQSNSGVMGSGGVYVSGFIIPTTRSTDIFRYQQNRSYILATLDQESGKHVKLFLSAPTETDALVFRPTLSRRKRIVLKGNTTLHIAKIEIISGNGVVLAYDADVVLTGSYEGFFSKLSWRLFSFQRITFDFDEPRN